MNRVYVNNQSIFRVVAVMECNQCMESQGCRPRTKYANTSLPSCFSVVSRSMKTSVSYFLNYMDTDIGAGSKVSRYSRAHARLQPHLNLHARNTPHANIMSYLALDLSITACPIFRNACLSRRVERKRHALLPRPMLGKIYPSYIHADCPSPVISTYAEIFSLILAPSRIASTLAMPQSAFSLGEVPY